MTETDVTVTEAHHAMNESSPPSSSHFKIKTIPINIVPQSSNLICLSRLTLVFIKTYSCFYQDLLLFLSRLIIVFINCLFSRFDQQGERYTQSFIPIFTVLPAEAQHCPYFKMVLTSNIRIYHGFDHVMWRNAGQIHGANNVFRDKIMCARKQAVL